MSNKVYLLGGYQSDFARNISREGHSLFDLYKYTVVNGLQQAHLDAKDISVAHIGNFVADRFTGQGHLGGFFGHIHPNLAHVPASRHEAACASGSMAILAAMADIQSGRYDLACVLGIEQMRNVSGLQAAENLRGAAWVDQEMQDANYLWPCAFSQLIDEYDKRYGVNKAHLSAISKKNLDNAKNNPNAQTRSWNYSEANFEENEETNPTTEGRIRRYDCGQVTDGAAVVFLASESAAKEYAKKRGLKLENLSTISGWGHINSPMHLKQKFQKSAESKYVFPHLRTLFSQTLERAGITFEQVHGMEVHDCFNITEYMILDHLAVKPAGQAWQAIEEGYTQASGKLPINTSGGLIGLGHPVGATGVRMLLDGYKQVTDTAGDYQIAGAKNILTFNLGGAATTCASFIVSSEEEK